MKKDELSLEQAKLLVGDIGKMVTDLSDALYKEEDAKVRIERLLDAVVEFFGADRAYVIEGEMDPLCAENVYERCAEGKEHQRDTLKDFPQEAYQYWLNLYKKSEIVVITDMEKIREERPEEYEFFKDSGVKSLIMAPFHRGDNCGFVGVDNPTHYIDQPKSMAVIAYIIGNEVNVIDMKKRNKALIDASAIPEDIVEVKLMGDLRIKSKSGTLHSKDFTPQARMIITMLLLKEGNRLDMDEMFSIASVSQDSSNPNRVVRTAIHRLRNVLKVIDLKELVLMNHDGCSLNKEYVVHSDVDRMNDLAKCIKASTDEIEKITLCHEVLSMFEPLHADVNNTITGSMESGHLNMIYHTVTKVCAELHMMRGEYDDAYTVIRKAIRLDPRETGLLLDMAKLYTISNTRGKTTLINGIRQHLSVREVKILDKILLENQS